MRVPSVFVTGIIIAACATLVAQAANKITVTNKRGNFIDASLTSKID